VRTSISQHRSRQPLCACESPICPLVHVPALPNPAPASRGLHRAVVARLIRAGHSARTTSRATRGALVLLPGRGIGVRREPGAALR
jgi:hypothetical protein